MPVSTQQSFHPGRRFRRPVGVALSCATAIAAVQLAAGPAQAADPLPVTYQGATYPAAGPMPTEDKPQSKLWFTDGSWWALMRVPAGITIHRLVDHVWRDTGTVVDERLASTGDALWEDGKLFVASRVSGGALRAIRLSYDPVTDVWTRDLSEQVASNGSESISIARDTTDHLWVTFTQGRRVFIAHTTTDDATWTPAYPVPVPDNTVAADDISGIVAFGGKIGVLWSDQDDDAVRFAVHVDGAPDSTWAVENALAGPNLADDHLNIKSLSGDGQGRIYAAVKTSLGDSGEPAADASVVVLQRTGAGVWTGAVAAQVGDRLTRPQIALDAAAGRLYVLMSTEGGGTVYYKSSSLDALAFPTGKGEPFIRWTGASINDATTTKQTVDATTGLVVLASDENEGRYYHGELSLGGAPVPPAPLVYGDIGALWNSMGGPASVHGLPLTEERTTPNGRGRYNTFQDGGIYWLPSIGARSVHGAIYRTWADLGWEGGFLGFPVTNETTTPDGVGRFNHFEGGSVYWTPGTGAHEVHGAIRARWQSLGWERSALGYPTSNEYPVPGGRRSDFQHGSITWVAATGAVVTSPN